jgi:hypothetical protein
MYLLAGEKAASSPVFPCVVCVFVRRTPDACTHACTHARTHAHARAHTHTHVLQSGQRTVEKRRQHGEEEIKRTHDVDSIFIYGETVELWLVSRRLAARNGVCHRYKVEQNKSGSLCFLIIHSLIWQSRKYISRKYITMAPSIPLPLAPLPSLLPSLPALFPRHLAFGSGFSCPWRTPHQR